MSRFEDLLNTVAQYQQLADENYQRVRRLAEEIRTGLCQYMGTSEMSRGTVCVRLVPPSGPFEARDYGDQAFSIPAEGFRPLGAILFGLAFRVSGKDDWMRVTLECQKIGSAFMIHLAGGEDYTLSLPLQTNDTEPFYEHLYQHVLSWFQTQIEHYQAGEYGRRDIGFDFSRDAHETAQA